LVWGAISLLVALLLYTFQGHGISDSGSAHLLGGVRFLIVILGVGVVAIMFVIVLVLWILGRSKDSASVQSLEPKDKDSATV
jgi:uncharacterized membrane protein